MVQSTEHEIYRCQLADGTLAGWGIDGPDGVEEGASLPNIDDRTSTWGTSVPGESGWVTLVRCMMILLRASSFTQLPITSISMETYLVSAAFTLRV
jgi:hypothetical protein